MNEAAANISWLPFDPRDWEQLTPAFGRLRSMVGAHGPKLIANNRAAAFFDRCVHEGRLELALVAPDLTYRRFDAAERQELTIRAPLNYEEGCSIEPYHEGHWYVQRSNLEKLTAIPVTPVARAEAELVPARIPPAESAPIPPAEPPRGDPVPPPESAPATGVGDQAVTAIEPAGTQPRKPPGPTFDPSLVAAVKNRLEKHRPGTGGNDQWERFCDEVRKACKKKATDRGCSDKTIQRIVAALNKQDK